MFAHRIAKNRSTGLSPYVLIYRVKPQFPYDNGQENPNVWQYMISIVESLPCLREKVRKAIKRAQENMKRNYPIQKVKQTFKEGDEVTLYWKLAET